MGFDYAKGLVRLLKAAMTPNLDDSHPMTVPLALYRGMCTPKHAAKQMLSLKYRLVI